jgi:hypothetical protein
MIEENKERDESDERERERTGLQFVNIGPLPRPHPPTHAGDTTSFLIAAGTEGPGLAPDRESEATNWYSLQDSGRGAAVE